MEVGAPGQDLICTWNLDMCPNLTYYAGTCLSGWSNCTKLIMSPNLECIDCANNECLLNEFMKLFVPY
jgi:hypothetical protein